MRGGEGRGRCWPSAAADDRYYLLESTEMGRTPREPIYSMCKTVFSSSFHCSLHYIDMLYMYIPHTNAASIGELSLNGVGEQSAA